MTTLQERVAAHFAESIHAKQEAEKVLVEPTAQAAELMLQCLMNDGKILACGNGGSAADAQHFAAEMTGRFEKERMELAAVAAGHGDDVHIAFVCRFDGFDNVGGVAGGGDADQNVAGTSECAHLFAEYVVETIVVADGGQGGSVRRQRDRGQFHALFFKASGHFGGEVLRVGSRTAVAAG